MMRVAVVVFPGSNCDVDALRAVAWTAGMTAHVVRHDETDLGQVDAVILPGGFSYGDYLRCGALAAATPVMQAVRAHAAAGKLVLGICNGFQILCEAGLLPGALSRNDHQAFRCDIVPIRVESTDTPFTCDLEPGTILQLPIAHGEGNYISMPHELAALEARGGVVLRYADSNPNGSVHSIAGITNTARNVLGMMPHPERALRDWMGSHDGRAIFSSMITWHTNNSTQREEIRELILG